MSEPCNDHSGFCEAIKTLKEDDKEQWLAIRQILRDIDQIRIQNTKIMGGIVIVMFTLVGNLVVMLARL